MDKAEHTKSNGATVDINETPSPTGGAAASRESFWRRVWLLYYEGFRNMTVGRSLWVVILIKLFLMFVVIKWIFFPDFLSSHYDNDADKAVAVREKLTNPNR